MVRTLASFAVVSLASVGAACGGKIESNSQGGSATANISGTTFQVSNVTIAFASGEDGYFRIEGDDAAHANDDCLPGLPGGLALYGDVPAGVMSLQDLRGKDLPFEFTGDGDDANLCFVGSNGLLGVEAGTVRFEAVEGDKVTFSFSGGFKVYDGVGGESATPVNASGNGTAYASK